MDGILKGVMASNHKENLKRCLFTKLSKNASKTENEDELINIYKTAMAWIVYSESDFEEEMAKMVLKAWGRQNQPLFRDFLLRYCHTIDLDDFVQIDKNINFIHVCLRILDDRQLFHRIIQENAIALARDKAPLCSLAALCRLLVDIPECIPKADKMKGLCIMLIKCVNMESVGRTDINKQKDVEAISALLHYIWHNNITITVIPSLMEIFRTISSVEPNDPKPSIAIAALVQRVPVAIIRKITKDAAFDQSIPDLNMTAALARMIDWLAWPGVKNIHLWINAFLKNLAAAKKYSILMKVTCETIVEVFEKLSYSDVRESSLAVLSHMLLSFQHQTTAFHKIVDLVPDLVKSWREQGLDEQHEHLKKLAELIYCQMYQHAGYPELYQPLLDVFQDISQPTEESMKQMLLKSAWTCKESYSDGRELATKSSTGKTGLINLGNTCYLNSIVQALYMTDGFSDDILYEETVPSQRIRPEIRKLFAFLKYSNRAAFEPKKFVEVARPPWFTLRAQQDCSEFLKYLLDRLDEEDKMKHTQKTRESSSKKVGSVGTKTKHTNNTAEACGKKQQKSVTEKYFSGESLTRIRCLNCNHESMRTEIFYDLPLAFPDSGDSKRMLGGDPNSARNPSSHDPEHENAECGPSSSNSVPNFIGPVNWRHDKFVHSAIPESAVGGAPQTGPTSGHDLSEVNKEVHIEEMLEHYISPELMEGDNKYNCENCLKLQDAQKTLEITQSPQVLILTLMRFAYDVKTCVRRKILTDVKYPEVLELPLTHTKECKKRPAETDLASTDGPGSKRSRQNTKCTETNPMQPSQKYTLSAVVFHSGSSSESGHYFCYARNLNGQTDTNWHSFNDCRVTHSSYESFSKVMKQFNRDSAYVLFYKRTDDCVDGAMDTADLVRILPSELKDLVTADNVKFLKEQEAAAKRTQKRVSYSTGNIGYHRPDDSDDRDGPSLGGGGGGFNTPISRFVC